MKSLLVKIIEYVDDSQPGWVRCTFKDIEGKEWFWVDKVPIVSGEWLNAKTVYPRDGGIACQIIGERLSADNRKILTIDISVPTALETEDGETKFDVYSDQIEAVP
jgi:hypothetical protein